MIPAIFWGLLLLVFWYQLRLNSKLEFSMEMLQMKVAELHALLFNGPLGSRKVLSLLYQALFFSSAGMKDTAGHPGKPWDGDAVPSRSQIWPRG